MEHEARGSAPVARSQNAVYVMPHDWASISQFLEPLIERIDEADKTPQLLVVTTDAGLAAAVAAAAVRLVAGRGIQILAATATPRATRLLRARPAQVVTGTAPTIAELLRGASLKLDAVRGVCIAWADEVLVHGDQAALETVMTEVPKEAARVIVATELTAAVDALVERYARRARKVGPTPSEGTQPMAVEYVAVSLNARLDGLRRVLDAVDPASALVFVREEDSRREVTDLLRSMGYDENEVRAGLVAAPETASAILYDFPASREELREAAGAAKRAIALVQPRQIANLRAFAAGGAVKPLTLPETGQRAREDDARLRAELRGALEESHFGRELLALEPLLEDFDGIEIAAGLLQILERDRHAHRAAMAALPAGQRDAGPMVRLFVGVGSRENVRASDLVGAIANQGGISSAELGRVDVRDSHSIVEVAGRVAETVIEKVNGVVIKGRRAVVRLDKEPGDARRSSGGRERSSGGGDRRPRDGRGGSDRPSGRPAGGARRPPRGRE